MIKIEKTEVLSWEAAIRGMRNPMNSWDKSDSGWRDIVVDGHFEGRVFNVGEEDLDLMKKLVEAGPDHSKFMRMIIVTCDITAPLYWWKEFDTYKVGTVANSCSTMHKIHAKKFTPDDFSHEHLCDLSVGNLSSIIEVLNTCRELFLAGKDKRYWWQMIQLLPTSYNQKRTVMLNYQVVRNMYHARKNHKLDEWRTFCSWAEELPLADDLIC